MSDRGSFKPVDFCLSYKVYGERLNVYNQEDSQEFLTILIDQLENSIKNSKYKFVFRDLFIGKFQNILTCQNCNNVGKQFENFYFLTVEVKHLNNIYKGLEHLIQEIYIQDYNCDNCKTKSDLKKSVFLN